MAPATNECYYMHCDWISNKFVLDSCKAAVPNLARDYWRATHRITTQAMCK